MKQTVDFPTKYKIGDCVRSIHERTLIGAFPSMTIEGIDFDHNHTQGVHRPECMNETRIEYHVVVGARPDGSAEFRARVHAQDIRNVR